MKRIGPGEGIADIGAIEKQSREYLDQLVDKPNEVLPQDVQLALGDLKQRQVYPESPEPTAPTTADLYKPVTRASYGYGDDYVRAKMSIDAPKLPTKADIAELIYAEWAAASDKHFPWWIQTAADNILARIEGR